MNGQTATTNASPKRILLAVGMCVAGLAICTISVWAIKASNDKQLAEIKRELSQCKQLSGTDSAKQAESLLGSGKSVNATSMSDDERKHIIDDVCGLVERGLKAKYGRAPKNPSDDEMGRITSDIEYIAEQELNGKYKHLPDSEREFIKKEIVLEFHRSMASRKKEGRISQMIKELERLSDEELEPKAQSGDVYAQYVYGERLLKPINDIYWMYYTSDYARLQNRIQEFISKRNDYARYALERKEYLDKFEKSGYKHSKDNPRPGLVNDFKLLNYSGELLLASMETALEKDMVWSFIDTIGEEMVKWKKVAELFQTPLVGNPDFVSRWKAVVESGKIKAVDIPELDTKH